MTGTALASDGEGVFLVNPIGRRAGKGGHTRMTDRFEPPRINGGRAVHWA